MTLTIRQAASYNNLLSDLPGTYYGTYSIDKRLKELQHELFKKARNKEEYNTVADELFRLTKLKEQLVRRLIEKVTICEDKFTVEFKSRLTVDVEE